MAAGRTYQLAVRELCVVLQLVAEGVLAWVQVVCVVGGDEVMAHGKVTISEHLHKYINYLSNLWVNLGRLTKIANA